MKAKERKQKEIELKKLKKDAKNVGSFGWAFAYDKRIKKLEKELESNEVEAILEIEREIGENK